MLAYRAEYNLINMISMPSPIFIITLFSSISPKPSTQAANVSLLFLRHLRHLELFHASVSSHVMFS